MPALKEYACREKYAFKKQENAFLPLMEENASFFALDA